LPVLLFEKKTLIIKEQGITKRFGKRNIACGQAAQSEGLLRELSDLSVVIHQMEEPGVEGSPDVWQIDSIRQRIFAIEAKLQQHRPTHR
jgi:hypothetical protein